MPQSRVKSEFNGIMPGGAFEQSRSGLPATFPDSGRQWYSLAQWMFCNSSGIRSDNRNSRTFCDGFVVDRYVAVGLYVAEWGGSSRAHEVGRGIDVSAFGDYLAHNIKPWVVCN